MRTTLLATLIALVCFAAAASCIAADRPGPIVQPTDTAGATWKLTDNPMPPIASIIARPLESRPIYGLYGWAGEYRKFHDSILKVGYRSVRLSGPFDDKTMTLIVQDDMELMLTLAFHLVTPEGRTRKNRTHYDSDEAFIAAYIEYAEGVLKRYGPGGTFFADNPKLPKRPIMAVEILNEPNFHYMLPELEGVSRREIVPYRERLYAKLLPAAYRAIKATWPTVKVVGFATAAGGRSDVPFVTHVHQLSPSVGPSYDILSLHPYSKPGPYEGHIIKKWGGWANIQSLHEIRIALDANGAKNKPIWFTELGWPISADDGGKFAPPQAKRPFTPILLQGAYIVRQYAMAMRLGVGRVHIMHATDTDRFNGGVFTQEGVWRPAAFATQTMIKLMPNPKLLSAIHDGADGLYAYRFDPNAADTDKTPVLMAWNMVGPKTIQLPAAAAKMAAVDMVGNRTPLTVTDGKVSVEIGPCPVYVVVSTESD